MIKDGKYEFLDFEAHRDEIENVLIAYYGEDHADTIKERMAKVTYVPYVSYDYVSTYCNTKFDKYKDELIAEYMRLSGRSELTDEQRELVWNNGGSQIFASNLDGKNLPLNTFLGDAQKQLMEVRTKVCDAFGIDKQDCMPAIIQECRYVKQAVDHIMHKYPCEAFADLQKFIENKKVALQIFLTHVNKNYLRTSEADEELLSQSDFDSYSAESLDSKYIMYGGNITEPGLMQYFTSESRAKLKTAEFEERLQILRGRVRFYCLNVGPKNLKYVTEDEIFGREEIADEQEFYQRLAQENNYQIDFEQTNYISTYDADNIEKYRQLIVNSIYAGCKFAKFVNRPYNGSAHHPDSESNWFTTMEYVDGDFNRPVNHLYFNENQFMSVDEMDSSLLHECNHAVSNGHAIPVRRGKEVYCGYGLSGYRARVNQGKVANVDARMIDYNRDGVLLIEEDCNERMAKEIFALYRQMYGSKMFSPCDFNINAEGRFDCSYDYTNFLTEGFWQRHKEDIKHFRVTEGANIYYDVDRVPPRGVKEMTKATVKYIYDKHVTPEKLNPEGKISYRLLKELGFILTAFKKHMIPILDAKEIKPSDVYPENFDNLDLTDQQKGFLRDYKKEADKIIALMQQEEETIRRARTRKQENQVNRQVFKLTSQAKARLVREKLRSVLEGKNSRSSQIAENFKNRKIRLSEMHSEEESTMVDE